MTGIKEGDFGKVVSRSLSDVLYHLAPVMQKLCCDLDLRCVLAKNNLDLDTVFTVQDCTRILTSRETLKQIFGVGSKQLMRANTMNPDFPKEDKAIIAARQMWDSLYAALQAALNKCKTCYEARYKIEVTLDNKTNGEYHEP